MSTSDDTRLVRVKCTWESEHLIEVPADTPRIDANDLDSVLVHEDVDSSVASLTDWEVIDTGKGS